jgi:GNAT superfamily N-acetyltransferase
MQKQLRDGLILRSLSEGHASDRERLPQFYFDVFKETGPLEEEKAIIPWTQDLMEGHPTVTPDDIFLVVDPAKEDMIVSATLLIPQVWRYEDVELPVGRPEIVATHPEYRRRGLVRSLFEVVHERSAALGHNVLAITGIPHYYRQFGYTMAVDLGLHATITMGNVKQPDNVRFTLRPATNADIPDLMRWADYFARERLLSTVHDETQWHYELNGRREGNGWKLPHLIIVNEAGEGVGYVSMRPTNFRGQLTCFEYVVGEQSSYLETFNDVIFGMKQWGTERFGECPPMLGFATGVHDTLSVMIDRMIPGSIRRREYAWYLRVVDLVRLIRDITPVLERRLEGSGAHRYTGTLAIGFFDKTALKIEFERGCVKDAVIVPMDEGDADVSFPYHMFLNVAFGYHTTDEIRSVLPDIGVNQKAAVLLPILFPKKRSWLMAIV